MKPQIWDKLIKLRQKFRRGHQIKGQSQKEKINKDYNDKRLKGTWKVGTRPRNLRDDPVLCFWVCSLKILPSWMMIIKRPLNVFEWIDWQINLEGTLIGFVIFENPKHQRPKLQASKGGYYMRTSKWDSSLKISYSFVAIKTKCHREHVGVVGVEQSCHFFFCWWEWCVRISG